jgi:flagellar biosynthesis/type III secretory pathway protein FliH
MSDSDDVSELRGHIDAAHQAADRLVREAQARAEQADAAFRERLQDVPPRGWDVPHEAKAAEPGSELQVIVSLLGALRDAIPTELSQQLAEAVRELLLAVRALIDWYLDRLERLPIGSRPPQTAKPDDHVEDIPIA